MSAFDKLPLDQQERLETAAAWWSRLREEPSLELSTEFLAWIGEPGNSSALQSIESVRSALDEFRATPRILDMRRAALTSFKNASVKRWVPRRLMAQAAAAAVLIVIASGTALYIRGHTPTTYTTDAGERRVVALVDGSRISMDSDSEVQVRYTRAARTVILGKGRARFDVAHDVKRPFTVTAGAETVVAVGTSFDVEKLGSKVVVTLIQGHVLIQGVAAPPVRTSRSPAKETVSLLAGEQLVAAQDVKPIVAHANLDAATAWEAGHLVFLGEPLADAVNQVNRYTDRPIAVDPSAASIRISGVFNAGDIGSFVGAITAYFPVEATINDDDAITLRRRHGDG